MLAVEAGAAAERSPSDLREVGNYVAALEYGLQRLDTLPLSLRLIREMHARLMRGIRGDAALPGEFRRSQNWIGPPGCVLNEATYVPPPPWELMPCLASWERFLHDDGLPPLIHAAIAHSQFEATREEYYAMPSPLLYLSAYFEATRWNTGCNRARRVGRVADVLPDRGETSI